MLSGNSKRAALLFITALLLCACAATPQPAAKYPAIDRDDIPGGRDNDIYARPESIFGPRGLMGAVHDVLHTKSP
jgi:hypothetical protein